MKIAMITGASSGLGRETLIQIADRFGGLDEIWAIARRADRLEELHSLIPSVLRVIPLDLADQTAWQELNILLTEMKPEVKLLVNAAGYGKIGAVGSISFADETGMVGVNCQALCAVTNMVLPYMSRNSRIIQYASSAAFLPQPQFAVYAATKAFVLSYSRALNMELRPRGIYVTAVCPGPVRTEFFDVAETNASIPVFKKLAMADPKKVAALALRDSMMGKDISVYGPLMKTFRIMTKILPHPFILNFKWYQ